MAISYLNIASHKIIQMLFKYRAKTLSGQMQSGTVEASTEASALAVLQKHNLIPLAIEEVKHEGIFEKKITLGGGVKGKDLVIFSRSLAALFDAGVPLVEALRTLAEQNSNPIFKDIISQIAEDVNSGLSFSKALTQHKKVFSPFYISMVKIGEVSGNLQNILAYLSEYLEKEYNLQAKIRAALAYPGFIIGVFIIVGFIMFFFVIPQLAKIIATLPQENLPFLTKLLLKFSNPSLWSLFTTLAVIIGGGAFLIYYLRTSQGKRAWHETQLKMPIFGKLFKNIYQARFCENLSTLIKGGLPILQGLQITGDVVGNLVYQEIINDVARAVKIGNTIESVLSKRQEFDPLVVEMISVGERSGKLESILKKTAEFYTMEIDRTVSNLSALIEPILIVVLGVGVFFILAAILIPMYSAMTSFI